MPKLIFAILLTTAFLPAAALAAEIVHQECNVVEGSPNQATVTVEVGPSNAGDMINTARMTGTMFAVFNQRAIDVNCVGIGNGIYQCTSSKTFGLLETVTNVEYGIDGFETLNNSQNQTPFTIADQGVLCD